jgi:hypothetical protein
MTQSLPHVFLQNATWPMGGAGLAHDELKRTAYAYTALQGSREAMAAKSKKAVIAS